jgi:hypothetical protein
MKVVDQFKIDNGIRQYGKGWAFVCWSPGYFYFRLFGYGLHFKDSRKARLLFSERSGRNGKRIGSWIVKILKPFPKHA